MPGTGDLRSTARDLTRFVTAPARGPADHPGLACLPAPSPGRKPATILAASRVFQSFAGWLPDRSASIVLVASDEVADMSGLVRQLLSAAVT